MISASIFLSEMCSVLLTGGNTLLPGFKDRL
jgi:actin-related protein